MIIVPNFDRANTMKKLSFLRQLCPFFQIYLLYRNQYINEICKFTTNKNSYADFWKYIRKTNFSHQIQHNGQRIQKTHIPLNKFTTEAKLLTTLAHTLVRKRCSDMIKKAKRKVCEKAVTLRIGILPRFPLQANLPIRRRQLNFLLYRQSG